MINRIQYEKFGKFQTIVLVNDRGERVAVIPDFGATINELVLAKGDKKISVIEGYKTSGRLLRLDYCRSAKLTPFPNRIRDGVYSFHGRKYALPINLPSQNHAIHGFVCNKQFRIRKTGTDKGSAFVELEYAYRHEVEGYPFDFLLVLKYLLGKKGLTCTTVIKNTGKRSMPLGDGWHPYFTFQENVDDLYLKLPSKRFLETDERLIPTGKIKNCGSFEKLSKIGNTSLDTGFSIGLGGKISCSEIYSPKKDASIVVWQETGRQKYNFIQVFIPPSRKSIAIEPMSCAANAFNNRRGLIILGPNEKFNASCGVYLA